MPPAMESSFIPRSYEKKMAVPERFSKPWERVRNGAESKLALKVEVKDLMMAKKIMADPDFQAEMKSIWDAENGAGVVHPDAEQYENQWTNRLILAVKERVDRRLAN